MGKRAMLCELCEARHGECELRGCRCSSVSDCWCVQVLELGSRAAGEDQRLQLGRFYSSDDGFYFFKFHPHSFCAHYIICTTSKSNKFDFYISLLIHIQYVFMWRCLCLCVNSVGNSESDILWHHMLPLHLLSIIFWIKLNEMIQQMQMLFTTRNVPYCTIFNITGRNYIS